MQAAGQRGTIHFVLRCPLSLLSPADLLSGVCSYVTSRQVTTLQNTRGVIHVSGAPVVHFLQGLVTNDVRPLEKPDAAAVYAAFLTPKGKFMHDAFLHKITGSSALLLDVDVQSKEVLIQMLNRYRLRQKVSIQDVSDEYQVWAQFGQSCQEPGEWPRDPRLPELGFRAILHRDAAAALATGGQVASEAEYLQWRVLHGVAEGSTEIPAGKAHPLEYNLDGLHGVSYTKGCYIGQEKQSFTHFRGVIRRRLMPAHIQQPDGGAIAIGEEVVSEGGEEVGSVRAVAGGAVLAHLRLQEALAASQGETVLRLKGRTVQLVPFVPSWWPSEWTAAAEESPR